ncbi:MFS transporter [Pseudarthrobacter sp. GA104]|uniref:MFS transporter n=1 Tax=Pseudarthrobacter sp. GA104 TaxID=2676311 RepID=UPI0012F9F67D|nr:MFS transporter [Pseudarthrobacter sp. GA104]MUU69711.1 MFS transporter [Pseudarthrobacter sp. GA104]
MSRTPDLRNPAPSSAGGLTARRGAFRLRWLILATTALLLVLNYADRAALGVAGPQMIEQLGLSKAQFGLVASAFFFGYVPCAFLGGWLSDRYGPRSIMGVAVAWWSLFTALTAAGTGFVSLLIIRVLFGFGEGPQGSVSTKTMHNWFPQRQMGTAMGLVQGATPLGGVVGTPLVVWLLSIGDWRLAFIVLGAVGGLCTIGWFAVVRDRPDMHPWARLQDVEEQRERITAMPENSGADEADALPLRHYFKMPIIWSTAIAFFGYAWVLYTFLTWFPVYLTQERGVNLKELAVAGTIPWVFGVIGFVLGGLITDRIARRTGKPATARAVMIVAGLTVTAVLFALIGLADSTVAAVALMAAVVFVLYLTGAQYFAIVADIVPGRRVGGVMGFVHAIANLAGIAAPFIVGAIIDNTGSWATTFTLSGAVCIVGAALMAIFGRSKKVAQVV